MGVKKREKREDMKKIFRLSALFCAMTLLVTGCTQDETLEPQVKPAADGSEILFGARAGFKNADGTRTEYSGVDYLYENEWYERIDWTFDTDQVEIYSPHTANSNNTYYQVKNLGLDADEPTQEGDDHLHDYAYLQRMGDSGNLQWNGDGPHTFYAMYPSERMFDEPASEANGWTGTTVDMGIKMDKEVLTGVIPFTQVLTFDEDHSDANTYIFKPDMRFAYMAAKTTKTRAEGNVGLTFIPLVTAVEVELTFPDDGVADQTYHDVKVGEIEVTTKSNDSDTETQPLAGPFTADLTDWDGATRPEVSVVEGGKTYNSIQLSTYKWDANLGMSIPITLNEGQSLKFTVFLLPHQDIDDLCIKFAGMGGEDLKGKTLTDTQIPAGLKTRIKKMKLPTVGIEQENPYEDRSNWMGDLDPATEFRRLSLPGTGGSFSYNYKANDRAEYAEQYADMDLKAQWELGIRAFEVIVDRPSSATESLGGQDVKCNKEPMGFTFNKVMTDLTDWVSSGDYPDECAVVILTYQPEGNNPNRNCESFASSLHEWYENFTNKDVLKKYTPDLTIGEAKGKVTVIVRANQIDEKDDGSYANAASTLNNDPFVLINGCGTAKDRWGARGYKYKTTTTTTGMISGNKTESTTENYFPHISNSYSSTSIIEWYMNLKELFTTANGVYTTTISGEHSENNWAYTYAYDYTINRAEPGNPDQLKFGFYTGIDNAENENATICWFQEWHRVVATPTTGQASYLGNYLGVTWFESYYEKLDNAKTTYDMAVSGDEKYKNYIFINSLCGYLAEKAPGTTPSVSAEYGGSGGNYEGLAEKINPAFYNYVHERSQANTQGPTGIVMMDFVTNDDTLPHYYLPSLIIANNRKTGNVK